LLATASGGTPNLPVVNSFSSTAAALTIPNNDCTSGATIPITVSGVINPLVGTTTVSICTNLNLRGIADLRLRLCAPGGNPCINLVPSANGLGGNNMTNTCFSDASSTDINAGAAPYTGSFNPFGATTLSSLNGSSTNGTWTLTATDCGNGGAAGTFSNWSINFNSPPALGAYSYSWSPASGLSSTTSQNPTFSPSGLPISTVIKTVVATDANGCTSTASATMNIVDCSLLSIEPTLKLLNFTGNKVSDKNLLQWVVINDTESSLYVLERSSDGINFQAIGSIPSEMVNYEHRYEFQDNNPGNGTKYYRIKTLGFENNHEYSKIIALNHENISSDAVSIYPIPAEDKLNVMLTTKSNGNLRYEIKNTLGQKVAEGNTSINNGSNLIEIDINKLTPASYLLNLYFDGASLQRKIIKE
jgi:subtilisin-like proprotein convertase family protein